MAGMAICPVAERRLTAVRLNQGSSVGPCRWTIRGGRGREAQACSDDDDDLGFWAPGLLRSSSPIQACSEDDLIRFGIGLKPALDVRRWHVKGLTQGSIIGPLVL